MNKNHNKDHNEAKLSQPFIEPPQSAFARIRRYLFAGVLVTVPISLTFYLTYIFLAFVDITVGYILPQKWYESFYAHTTIPGIGLIIALVFFVVMGWLATNFLGQIAVRIYEALVQRVPLIRTLYFTLKQIFETLISTQSSAFREVVMLEYPRKGIWSIAFVTGSSKGAVRDAIKEETVNIFLPTTPNPTSGFLLLVPKKDLIYLDMSVEDGIKLVVSAGIISPEKESTKTKK